MRKCAGNRRKTTPHDILGHMEEHDVRGKKWYENAVIYQIYPRSFKDANGDGIGDLRGIIKQLDYLNDGTEHSLGVDALWLSPIYASPMKDIGYDVTDHCAIDPSFGTLDDFDELIEKAHARGILIIMDYVTNHTSDQHPWFIESRLSKESPKRDWYVWHAPKEDGSPPNNWSSVFGGSSWECDERTGSYYLHHFLKEQPDLNWQNPEVREAMERILAFWVERGVDGFRVDAINHIYEDTLFRDDPPETIRSASRSAPEREMPVTMNVYSLNRPEMKNVVSMLCSAEKKYPGTFFVTESFFNLEQMLAVYQECDRVVPFNFNLLTTPWDARHYKSFIDSFHTMLVPGKVPNYVLGNHDQSRAASRLGHRRARLSAFLQLTLPGIAFIYYGEELGMRDVAIPAADIRDGAARQAGDNARSRDPSRTPLQWSKDAHAGFSTGEPWLPVANDFSEYNVETESRDPRSFLALYRTLIHLRKNLPALRAGAYQPLDARSPSVLAYRRCHRDDDVVVLLNFSEDAVEEPLPFSHGELIYTTTATGSREVTSPLTLQPLEGCLVKKKK